MIIDINDLTFIHYGLYVEAIVKFPNGFGAAVRQGPDLGYDEEEWHQYEVHILYGGEVCYSALANKYPNAKATHLEPEEVNIVLEEISELVSPNGTDILGDRGGLR